LLPRLFSLPRVLSELVERWKVMVKAMHAGTI
jgi:hypothetical protein